MPGRTRGGTGHLADPSLHLEEIPPKSGFGKFELGLLRAGWPSCQAMAVQRAPVRRLFVAIVVQAARIAC